MQMAQETELGETGAILRDSATVIPSVTERLHHECHTAHLPRFQCETGVVIEDVTIAYETWGTMNASRDNLIVVCHALTGDAHAGPSSLASVASDGWWRGLIGPGKALDTDKYFIICSNVLGGCAGTTGPSSSAADGQPYALRFPMVGIRDMVHAQMSLLDSLEVGRDGVELVIGGSLGGMQVWEWLLEDTRRVKSGMVIAAHAAFPPLAIGYNAAMRQAITSDPAWHQGEYYRTNQVPAQGLALARTIGMLTYRAGELYDTKFERRQKSAPDTAFAASAFIEPRYEVESYLAYNGNKFVSRFDANSYLYLTKAMDGHDIGRGRGGLENALAAIQVRTTVVGINSDYLYHPADLRRTVDLARTVGAPLTYQELDSPHGHDAFLIEYESLGNLVKAHLRGE
ncbi:homoserine O-acetyltransferase [Alicyclobacillus mengziensis]|uniref:Homoserine O-acetyltransferase n=2 Tax=Alicyclobacillus mengziensis TaxID=2931921 RepID=A0A9X7Z911_9BACL|nr:homoserine O-acetyltransferase [Alicyclobacillus mengziensis]